MKHTGSIQLFSISRRLSAILIVAVGLVSVVTISVLYFQAIWEQEDNLKKKANEYVEYLVGALKVPLWNYDENAINTICKTFLQNELVSVLVIKETSGRIIFPGEKSSDLDVIKRTGKIYYQGELLGEVEISFTKRYVKETGHRLLTSYAMIMLFVSVSLVFLSNLFLRIFLKKPLNTLDKIIQPYILGVYDSPIPKLPYTEFQEFGKTLSIMGETIQLQITKIMDAERKYHSIFENAMEGIFQITPEKHYLSVNPAFAKIHGYDSPEDLIASVTDIEHQLYVNPEDLIRLMKIVEINDFVERVEVEKYRKDGTKIWVSINAHTVRDHNGEMLYFEGSINDITERKQTEEEIRKLNQELEQRVADRTAKLETVNRELESFSYSVSHDLRAPLRSIDGFSQILLEDYQNKIDEQGKNYLKRIRSSSQRMAQLIEDILNLSRVSRDDMNIQQVNLSKIALTIANELQGTQPERKVEFIIQEEIKAQGDSRLLRIVLENLIGNAWKYTSKHSAARIEFGMQQQKEEMVYFVRDDGAGFDMNHTYKLFGAFQRLHTVEEFQGTGIGLATVQRVIHRHGGKVWAEGEIEKGATFYFTLT